MYPLQVALQFLQEEGYDETFESLQRESEVRYRPNVLPPHVLRQALGEIAFTEQTQALRAIVSGPTYNLFSMVSKVTFAAAPISMITVGSAIVVSFSDESLSKLSTSNEVILTANPHSSTVLCFLERGGDLFCGTMGGFLLKMSVDTLEMATRLQLDHGWILALTFCGGSIVAGSRNGLVSVVNPDTLTLASQFRHGSPITAMCPLADGVMYAMQNDPVFHFRAAESIADERLFSMNPETFDIGCLAIRELAQSPSDPNVFLALTDQGRAHVYRFTPSSDRLDVLKILTKFLSDGLTQPQVCWKLGPVVFATTSDWKVMAVEIEHDVVRFIIDGFKKATRCLTLVGDVLVVGSFDRTVSMYQLMQG
jgi:WD40 repeat protein